ncbi:hypothetical protein ARALYDRAFT_346083 [Arabidopsis lyrata subsp. lyrata]|uniref:Transcription elongation factor TFIIS/CRSP70 N-terminal sub-type domain-containing protein n=1 Tax=Arabidopsis lyrata subsp. lyrata TaxID=81972 RepID=D7LJC4_ARALL|nr:hypothetical protein ARALYDRAFT_346083 [Arabidopsis lyrata subsp. lyrata]
MQKQEFLELFKAAQRAAKYASDENSPEVARCIQFMKRLKEAPASLAIDVVLITNGIRFLRDHKNPQIRSEAQLLSDLWLRYLYATGREQSESLKDFEQEKVSR